jgi:hypothetical protein
MRGQQPLTREITMNQTISTTVRILLSALSLAGATLTISSSALALDCKADADCGAGFHCEFADTPVATTCAAGEQCTPPAPTPATVGSCQASPLACTSDASCPEYLTCVAPEVGCTTPACPEGANCPQPVDCAPPTDQPKTCQVRTRECKADADCFTGFQCILAPVGVACATPACPPGETNCPATDCPPPDTTPPTQGYCEPKQITCAADTDCPSDWSCVQFDEVACAGSGSTGGGTTTTPPSMGGSGASTASPGGTTPPAPPPAPGSKPTDTSTDPTTSCTHTVNRLCAPKGYVAASGGTASDLSAAPQAGGAEKGSSNGSTSSAAAVDAPAAKGTATTGAATNNASSGADDSTSCTVGAVGQGRTSGSGLLALGAAGLAAWLVRRRRA